MGRRTLRITIEQTELATLLTLEGRVAGPWAAELGRVWVEKAPLLALTKLSIDLCNVIYADEDGKSVLKDIYSQTQAELVASTPWTKHLAREITGSAENLS
jgi:hypothetical protein